MNTLAEPWVLVSWSESGRKRLSALDIFQHVLLRKPQARFPRENLSYRKSFQAFPKLSRRFLNEISHITFISNSFHKSCTEDRLFLQNALQPSCSSQACLSLSGLSKHVRLVIVSTIKYFSVEIFN